MDGDAIELEVHMGEWLPRVGQRAVALANETGHAVRFTFNGVPGLVLPGWTIDQAQDYYEGERHRIQEELRHAERRYTVTLNREQADTLSGALRIYRDQIGHADVARCPRCDKPLLIDEKGYGCSNCWGFMHLDLDTAPLEDVGIHQRFVLRERIAAEGKVADAQRKVARWLEKEAAIQARLEREREG